MIAYNLRHF